MAENIKSFFFGAALGATAFVFLFKPNVIRSNKRDEGIREYWNNVGKYLSNSIAEYERTRQHSTSL